MGIAVDSQGSAYVTGPLFDSANYTSFVKKLGPAGNSVVYRTTVQDRTGYAIAVDAGGVASITGSAPMGEYSVAFLAQLTGAGSITSNMLLSEATSEGRGIALDNAGNAYIVGTTYVSGSLSQAFGAKVAGSPLTLSITDAQGAPVTALTANDQGWPALNAATGNPANPITLTVTVNNTTSDSHQYGLRVPLGSANNAARFYVFAEPSTPLGGGVLCPAPATTPRRIRQPRPRHGPIRRQERPPRQRRVRPHRRRPARLRPHQRIRPRQLLRVVAPHSPSRRMPMRA